MWSFVGVLTMIMSFMVMMVFITTGGQNEIKCKN